MADELTEVVSVREYRAEPGAGWKAAMFIGGGVLFLLVLAAQFVLLLGVSRRRRTG